MPYAPSLTTYTDADPCPRVEVFFEEFDPAAVAVTVYRTAAGREYRVRGAVNAPTAGTLTRIDFECPFNIPVTYRAEMFDADGLTLGFTDATTLPDIIDGLFPGDDLLPGGDIFPYETITGAGLYSLDTWLHNPLDPHGAVKVQLLPSTAGKISRPVPGSVSYPRGRRVGVVLAEPRRGVAGLQFDVHATDLDTADKVQALIGTYSTTTTPVVCIRLGGDDVRMRVPKPLFLGVMDIVEEDVTTRWGGGDTYQRMSGDEVAPPIPGLFIPLLTAADINVSFATAAVLNASASQAFEINRRYDLAGAASA
jgi:hypothetical protein